MPVKDRDNAQKLVRMVADPREVLSKYCLILVFILIPILSLEPVPLNTLSPLHLMGAVTSTAPRGLSKMTLI